MNEQIDIVNEDDCVIGQGERSEIHRLGLRHRSSHLLITNQAGQLFLQKRAASKETFPNCWDSSVAGHVVSGENYEQCIRRECEEEIGVVCNASLDLLSMLSPSADNGWEFVAIFHMEYEGPFVLSAEEVSEAAWFEPPAVQEWLQQKPKDFADGFSEVFTRMNSN